MRTVKEELVEFSRHPSKTKDIDLRSPYLTKLFFSRSGLADKFKGFSFNILKNSSGVNSTVVRVKKAKKQTPVLIEEKQAAVADWASETEAYSRLALVTAATIVVSAILEAKKPIIGHHCSLDLGFIINQFLTDLPETYQEFKEVVRGLLPMIYDTKYIAVQSILKDHFGSSNLERITHILCNDPQYQSVPSVIVDPGICYLDPRFRRYHSGTQAHEAGYDAYMTGLNFACMGYMLLLNNPEKPELSISNFWLALKPFENKVHLSNHYKQCMELSDLNREDEAANPKFKYVLVVETTYSVKQLADLMAKYGDVRVIRNSDQELLVKLEQINPELETVEGVVQAAKTDFGLTIRKFAD